MKHRDLWGPLEFWKPLGFWRPVGASAAGSAQCPAQTSGSSPWDTGPRGEGGLLEEEVGVPKVGSDAIHGDDEGVGDEQKVGDPEGGPHALRRRVDRRPVLPHRVGGLLGRLEFARQEAVEEDLHREVDGVEQEARQENRHRARQVPVRRALGGRNTLLRGFAFCRFAAASAGVGEPGVLDVLGDPVPETRHRVRVPPLAQGRMDAVAKDARPQDLPKRAVQGRRLPRRPGRGRGAQLQGGELGDDVDSARGQAFGLQGMRVQRGHIALAQVAQHALAGRRGFLLLRRNDLGLIDNSSPCARGVFRLGGITGSVGLSRRRLVFRHNREWKSPLSAQ
mmetsp:Transcript_24860/g.56014  ORF Transcript_24860/g.56014 Transcript_24860/m.56014 type:complete len:336 (-) Transcript_24860:33-1040(-)